MVEVIIRTPTMPPTTPQLPIETAALCRISHLKMSPLVTISELNKHPLHHRRSNHGGLLPAESLTIASVDQEPPCYGVDDEPSTVVGRAPTKGTAPALTPGLAGTGTAPDGPITEALPL
jgi:hypothetical protein